MISLLLHSSEAFSGLELTVSKPYPGTALDNKGIYSLSYFTTGFSFWPGFSEWGITGMPSWGGIASSNDKSQTKSFVGLYGGHLFLLRGGFIRPGFELGSVWEETQMLQGHSNSIVNQSQLALYYAFKVQVLCLSFLVSNMGYGIGLNFSL